MKRAAAALVLLSVGLLVLFGGQNAVPDVRSGLLDMGRWAREGRPTPSVPVAATTWPPAPIPPGFRIQIPRLSIDLAIAEGDLVRDTVRQVTPEGYAFHLPGTAIPGKGGNSYIYSHARVGMFLPLWNARVGDEVRIKTPDGSILMYVVSEVHPRVDPHDVSWLTQGAVPEHLTLQTSTGPTPGDARFIVIAVPK